MEADKEPIDITPETLRIFFNMIEWRTINKKNIEVIIGLFFDFFGRTPPQDGTKQVGLEDLYNILAAFITNWKRAEEEHRKSGVYSEYKEVDATNECVKAIKEMYEGGK